MKHCHPYKDRAQRTGPNDHSSDIDYGLMLTRRLLMIGLGSRGDQTLTESVAFLASPLGRIGSYYDEPTLEQLAAMRAQAIDITAKHISFSVGWPA